MIQISKFMDSLRELSDEYAQELGPDGDWAPMLFVLKGDNVRIVGIPMPDQDQRDFFFGSVIPNIIKKVEESPDAVVMMNSTWFMTKDNTDGMGWRAEDGLPSEQPNPREGLHIVGITHNDEHMLFAEIIRGGEHPELDWEVFGSELENAPKFEGRLIASLRRSLWG